MEFVKLKTQLKGDARKYEGEQSADCLTAANGRIVLSRVHITIKIDNDWKKFSALFNAKLCLCFNLLLIKKIARQFD